jgi:hypothetical protein
MTFCVFRDKGYEVPQYPQNCLSLYSSHFNMKIKLLILLISLPMLQLQAQKTIPIPSTKAFEDYLYTRQHDMEAKLYKAGLEGRIKAYKTDSLLSVFSHDELKQRGQMESFIQNEEGIVSTLINPFSPADLKGLMFLEQLGNNPFDVSEKTALKGIGLLFQPSFGGFLANKQPIFWISTPDLKLSLDKEEMNFLSLLYFYSRHGNYHFDYWWTPEAEYDPYSDLNIFGRSAISPDSSFYKRICAMLVYSQFNTHDKIYFPDAGKRKIIFDEQQHKYIDLPDFEATYREKVTVFISTDIDDPSKGKDSVIYIPFKLEQVSAISFDNASKKISKYHFYLHGDNKTELKFYLDAAVNNQLMSTKPILWFYEDYIRWNKL